MYIGLIADESKKKLMQNLCIAYRSILAKHSVYATGSTGSLVTRVTDLKVHTLLHGDLGGVQQLLAKIEEGKMDAVIYLRNPRDSRGYEDDMVIQLCDQYNIPLATNAATAESLILALDNGDLAWRELYR